MSEMPGHKNHSNHYLEVLCTDRWIKKANYIHALFYKYKINNTVTVCKIFTRPFYGINRQITAATL
jgi:hypothetical protein